MAQKIINVPGLGEVTFTKRRSSKAIRLTLGGNSQVRVTLPTWVPYQAAVTFLLTKKDWVVSNTKSTLIMGESALIGKSHRVHFITDQSALTPKSRVTDTEIRMTHHPDLDHSSALVQNSLKKAGMRALKQEGENLLPPKLKILADKHDFTYNSVSLKRLKARWGSCSHRSDITLNIFLMQLPWHLIDYVLVHELSHTKALHHGPDFWKILEKCMPDAKQRKKELKAFHPYF